MNKHDTLVFKDLEVLNPLKKIVIVTLDKRKTIHEINAEFERNQLDSFALGYSNTYHFQKENNKQQQITNFLKQAFEERLDKDVLENFMKFIFNNKINFGNGDQDYIRVFGYMVNQTTYPWKTSLIVWEKKNGVWDKVQ